MSQASDAEDGHQVRGPSPAHLDSFICRDSSAGKRRSFKRIDPVGYFTDVPCERFGILGIAAIQEVAGIELLFTQRLPPGNTIFTCPTGIAEPGDGHTISLLHFGHFWPNPRDPSNTFMAGNKG